MAAKAKSAPKAAAARGTTGQRPVPPLLHEIAGAKDEHIPGGTGVTPVEGGVSPSFILEVLSVEEKDGEIIAVESGRGQKIRAKAADAEILEPAAGSKLKRVRLQPGKFTYD